MKELQEKEPVSESIYLSQPPPLQENLSDEDRRVADWIYLVPLSADSVVLVLGCSRKIIPLVLSENCGRVYVVDSNQAEINLLKAQIERQGINNLFPVQSSNILDLKFPPRYFDFISVQGFAVPPGESISFQSLIQQVRPFLREGGVLQVTMGNQLDPRQLIFAKQKNPNEPFPHHTYWDYRRILKSEGFSDVQFHAPLPGYRGIPLFYVPLEDRRAVGFFLRNVFPLCETVSHKRKQAYAIEYGLAKIATRLMLALRLSFLLKFFVPGYSVIAKNKYVAKVN